MKKKPQKSRKAKTEKALIRVGRSKVEIINIKAGTVDILRALSKKTGLGLL